MDGFIREDDVRVEFPEDAVVPPRVVSAVNSRENLDRQNEILLLLHQPRQVVSHHNGAEKNK